MYGITFKKAIVNFNALAVVRKELNNKQAHTAEPKRKRKKGMTLVQIDKKSHFAIDEAALKRFYRIQNDYEWIMDHKVKLTTEYPNKYIAVENMTVRFTGETVEALMQEIARNNEQVDNFAIEYLNEHPRSFLF